MECISVVIGNCFGTHALRHELVCAELENRPAGGVLLPTYPEEKRMALRVDLQLMGPSTAIRSRGWDDIHTVQINMCDEDERKLTV